MHFLHQSAFELVNHCVSTTILIEVTSLETLAGSFLEIGWLRLGDSLLTLLFVEFGIELILRLLKLLLGDKFIDLRLEGILLVSEGLNVRHLLLLLWVHLHALWQLRFAEVQLCLLSDSLLSLLLLLFHHLIENEDWASSRDGVSFKRRLFEIPR